ncbi:hypothetical protein U1Q18_011408 [Sarracenia purpurea var. burkii]
MGAKSKWRSFPKLISTSASHGTYQDAYALCRVFKKSGTGPKIADHNYVGSASNYQISGDIDHSSTTIDIYSEGSRYEDLRCCYDNDDEMPLNVSDGMFPMNVSHGMFPMNSGTDRVTDGNWIRHLSDSDDVFSFTNPSLQNHTTLSHSPSKVDTALGWASLQRRRSLPPLEVQDYFPQGDFMSVKTPQFSSIPANKGQFPREIPWVSDHQASQELISRDTWCGSYPHGHGDDDFSFHPCTNRQIHDPNTSSGFGGERWGDQNTRWIQIGGFDEEFTTRRMVENLRWVGVPAGNNLEQSFSEDYQTVPVENISCFQLSEDVQGAGETNDDNNFNDFNGDFLTDGNPNDKYLVDGDDFSSTPGLELEVHEEIEAMNQGIIEAMNQGSMFVSTRQAADTFFHQTMPSEIVNVYLNPETEVPNTKNKTRFFARRIIGWGVSSLVLNKRWPCITVALALCSIWWHHITPSP